jgi:tRNA modification GTPase
MDEKTIAAISTPIGAGGIGIVRLSGSLSETIAGAVFRSKRGGARLTSHLLQYGEIVDPDTGMAVDEVLLVLMRAPNTYTREDILEIQCHGGALVLQRILELVLKQGAELAQAGEFTKRAFLNGRIDLTQAEAVLDVIRARTTAGLDMANRQLRGDLWENVIGLKETLVQALAVLEAHIDFPEEELGGLYREEIGRVLKGAEDKVKGWVSTYAEARIFREGIACVIVGKANVGKSSLLNALLREDRAIVSPVPGTTRDHIEESLNLRGIPVRLTDTAGLRDAEGAVEQEGVRRSWQRVSTADVALVVVDGSRGLDRDDLRIFSALKDKKKLIAVNKSDLPGTTSVDAVRKFFPSDRVLSVSALVGTGLEDLFLALHDSLLRQDTGEDKRSLMISHLRHKVALEEAKERVSAAGAGLAGGLSMEFIAFEMRCALQALAEVVGETTTEEILDGIFGQFCIGK